MWKSGAVCITQVTSDSEDSQKRMANTSENDQERLDFASEILMKSWNTYPYYMKVDVSSLSGATIILTPILHKLKKLGIWQQAQHISVLLVL